MYRLFYKSTKKEKKLIFTLDWCHRLASSFIDDNDRAFGRTVGRSHSQAWNIVDHECEEALQLWRFRYGGSFLFGGGPCDDEKEWNGGDYRAGVRGCMQWFRHLRFQREPFGHCAQIRQYLDGDVEWCRHDSGIVGAHLCRPHHREKGYYFVFEFIV